MPAESASSNGTAERPYVMLEERTIADMLRAAIESGALGADVTADGLIAHFEKAIVYEELGTLKARNADHAYRQARKQRFGEGEGQLRVAAVSAKTWKPRTVRSKARLSVTVD
jgi:hypothetical protein